MRIIKGSKFTLRSPVFTAADRETPTNCDSTPTCIVTREDGTALTEATVTALETGIYTAAITTTHTSQVDRLQVVWSGTVATSFAQVYRETIEVVGAHYCTIPEIRAKRGLDDENKYPTAMIEEIRDQYEDEIERFLNVALVRRYERDRFNGDGTRYARLTRLYPRDVLSVTIDGTSQTTSNFDLYDEGAISWRSSVFTVPSLSSGDRNCKVAYEHGFDNPPPAIKREVLKAIRLECFAEASNDAGHAVISETFDGRTLRFSTPDPAKGRPTGILSLDPLLVNLRRDLSRRWPGIA